MKEIKPPKEWSLPGRRSLFIAGGISNTSDWQKILVKNLENVDGFVYNPRRDDFDLGDPQMTKAQIEWEYKYLTICQAVSFWFSPETLCPITLFELGWMLGQDKKIFIGYHPDYKRKEDIKIQVALRHKNIVIVDSIEDLSKNIISYYEVGEISYKGNVIYG